MQHWIFHDSGDGLDGTDGPTQEKKPARKKKTSDQKKKNQSSRQARSECNEEVCYFFWLVVHSISFYPH